MSFRIQNKRIALTYPTKITKEEYKAWFTENFPETSFLEMAHETGESGYEHTHVLVSFKKIFQTTNARRFDYNDLHPNIQKVTTDVHWVNWTQYLAKQDPDNKHLLVKSLPLALAVWSSDSLESALMQHVEEPHHAGGIIALWNNKPQKEITRRQPEWVAWQCDLDATLTAEPDYYKIMWIYDPIGGTGKTTYCEWKADVEDPNQFALISNCGSAYHMATVMESVLDSGWTGHCLLINMSRTKVDQNGIYESIEGIKDGRMTTLKYKGKNLKWNRPHVVVFANVCPDISKLSEGRWEIYEIVDETLRALNISSAREIFKREEQARRGIHHDTVLTIV